MRKPDEATAEDGTHEIRERKGRSEPVARLSAGELAERSEELKELFPEVLVESKIDFDKLRQTLGEEVESRPERYSLTWAGKRDCIRLLQTPSRATLVPATKESISFEETNNIFVEGDNLEVLKLLYKPYFGQAKTIYIDPPYNTGNDFVYPDDYSDPLNTYLQLTAQRDVEGNLLTSNPEKSGRYHSTWLTMMYPRLFMARQFLREDGVIFVSIDDHEVHNLRSAMNEVFGEENFIAQITVVNNPKGRVLGEHFAVCHDYVLAYSRLALPIEMGITKTEEEIESQYTLDEGGRPYRLLELRNTHRQFNRRTRPNLYFPIYVDKDDGRISLERLKGKIELLPNWDDGLEGCWTWGKDKVAKESGLLQGQMINGKWKVFRKAFAKDDAGIAVRKKLQTVWNERQFHTEVGQAQFDELIPGRIFEAPKPVELIKQLVRLSTEGQNDDLILDFFAGACTTAQAVLELNREDGGNRRFICVQLPEPTPENSNARKAGFQTVADVGKERVRRVVKRLRKEGKGKLEFKAGEEPADLGFRVFKLGESNFKPWTGVRDKEHDSYAKQMELHADPLIQGWKPDELIWEVAIKQGFGLNAQIEALSVVKGNKTYRVRDNGKDQSFVICLDDEIKAGSLKALELTREDIFICRDVALSDEAAANLALQCRLKTI